MTTHLLEVEGLTAGYGPVRVLHGLGLHVDAGEVVVVLGANGAGKTTTIRALCGMVPARGRVTFDSRNVLGCRPEAFPRMGVAHVPQGRGTFSDLTVEENLRLGAFVRPRRDGAAVAQDLERWYGVFPRLRERSTQVAGSLSGGEQQMLAIARALMSRPRLLLLDEPSLGLAPIVTREVFRTLDAVRRDLGTTLLLVEQNANLALDIADRAYLLEAGQIVATGGADELRDDESVRRAYLGY